MPISSSFRWVKTTLPTIYEASNILHTNCKMHMAGTGVMTNSPHHLWSLHYALDHEVTSLKFCCLVVTAKQTTPSWNIASFLGQLIFKLLAQDDSRPKPATQPCSTNHAHTHLAQFCKRKTNIYLYKDFRFLFCPKQKKGKTRRSWEGMTAARASTAGRAGLELAACSHFGFRSIVAWSEAGSPLWLP